MSDSIALNIPAKADYLLTARLTASSIGARMGFDVNDIEDIKTATAEACLIVMQAGKSSSIQIVFDINEKKLIVSISSVLKKTTDSKPLNEDNILGKYLLEALSDDVKFDSEKDIIKGVSFSKKLAGL